MTDEQAHRRARAAIEAAHARDDAAANAEAARDARELQALADGGRSRTEPPNKPRGHHHPSVVHPDALKAEVAAFDSAMVNTMARVLGSVGFIWFCIILDLLGFVALVQQTVQVFADGGSLIALVSLWVAFIAQAVIQLIALPVLQNYQNRQEASNAAKADADHQALTYLATLQDEQLLILRKLDTMTIPHGRGVAAEAQGA